MGCPCRSVKGGEASAPWSRIAPVLGGNSLYFGPGSTSACGRSFQQCAGCRLVVVVVFVAAVVVVLAVLVVLVVVARMVEFATFGVEGFGV